MFEKLLEQQIIDGYLNHGPRMVESGLSYARFACTGDGWHFCANGTAWMADEIDHAFGTVLSKN
jgi:hypothetical protein